MIGQRLVVSLCKVPPSRCNHEKLLNFDFLFFFFLFANFKYFNGKKIQMRKVCGSDFVEFVN